MSDRCQIGVRVLVVAYFTGLTRITVAPYALTGYGLDDSRASSAHQGEQHEAEEAQTHGGRFVCRPRVQLAHRVRLERRLSPFLAGVEARQG